MNFLQTIFRLPLRTYSQSRNSNLSERPVDPEEVLSLLTAYGKSAAHSVLNIHVGAMACFVRDSTGSSWRTLWSVKATRKTAEQPELEDLSCQQITLESVLPSGVRHMEIWHSITESIPIDGLPDEFKSLASKHKLRSHLKITLGGCVPSGGKKNADKDARHTPRGRLYSQLPLPTLTCLPIHIDAPFILADDRRSIRFEETGQLNGESKYNYWLLSERVPQLYTSLLQSWPASGNKDIWPGATQADSDPISRVIIKAFYSDRFACSLRRFCDTLSGARLAPLHALFLLAESASVMSIISLLRPPTFVKLPARIRSLLPPDARRVNATALRNMVVSHHDSLITSYRDHQIETQDLDALISRMLKESTDSVTGVRILPLADGSLSAVKKGPAPAIFTGNWRSSLKEEPWRIFPLDRFLHPDVQSSKDGLVALGLNVHMFDGERAVELIRDIIPSAAISTLSQAQQDKLDSLLRHIDKLDISLSGPNSTNGIRSIPLVPTNKPGTYVSLHHCEEHSVLALPTHSYLVRILEQLDIHLVHVNTCPPALRIHLYSLTCTFEDILQLFEQRGIPPLISQNIRSDDHERFAEFVKQHLNSLRTAHYTIVGKGRNRRSIVSYTVNHLSVARSLPIWKAQCNGQTQFVAACHGSLHMLPLAISLSVASPFLEPTGTYINFSNDLNIVLGVEPMSIATLCASVRFPPTMHSQQLPSLKRLLEALITFASEDSIASLDVPNVYGTMVRADTLYAHSNPVFRAAFATSRPQYFLHPELRGLESSLSRFGFHRSITMASFEKCARTIHGEFEETGRAEGASTVFAYYNTELWRLATVAAWQSLDHTSFIPRSRIRRNYLNGLDHSFFDYARPMPDIVSPSDILRPEHEAIAWTQRALFESTPSPNLLVAYPSLGVPRAEEVVSTEPNLWCAAIILRNRYSLAGGASAYT